LRENILLGYPVTGEKLDQAIWTAVIEEDVAAMDFGLNTFVGPRGVRLSGGQIQRAAAARSLVRKAELLVFDDLSSALDVETEQQLWKRLLASENGSRTYLVVSHRRAALCQADQIILLREGRVLDTGTLDELLVRSKEMQSLWTGEP
jgi:ATP-binding cassette subfamily B protein